MTLTSTEPIGPTARLGLLRLGASRLAAAPRESNLNDDGTYAWTRSDGVGGDVNDGRPAGSATGGWTTERS